MQYNLIILRNFVFTSSFTSFKRVLYVTKPQEIQIQIDLLLEIQKLAFIFNTNF